MKNILLWIAVALLPLMSLLGLYGAGKIATGSDGVQRTEKPQTKETPTKLHQLSRDKNDKEQNGRPLFLLHVGPSKTGTTTIQWFAGHNTALLEKNNVYYLGPGGGGSFNVHLLRYNCRSNDDKCAATWNQFATLVKHHLDKNHTIMVSEEKFCKFVNDQDEQEHLWQYLTPLLQDWNVRVLFSYRRFYEWLPSKYYQAYNPDGAGRYADASKKTNWPTMGGKQIPSFPNYVQEFLQEKTFKHPLAIKKRWEQHVDNVWVYNFHNPESKDFLEGFFCQEIPQATEVCHYLQTNQIQETKNPSVSKILHFDMLAVAAYQRGWVPKHMNRTKVTMAAQEYATSKLGYKSMMDFRHLECLSEDQIETLLNHSLVLEQELVPQFFQSQEQQLRNGFDAARNQGKFCSLDVNQVLKGKKWESFFQSLGVSKAGN